MHLKRALPFLWYIIICTCMALETNPEFECCKEVSPITLHRPFKFKEFTVSFCEKPCVVEYAWWNFPESKHVYGTVIDTNINVTASIEDVEREDKKRLTPGEHSIKMHYYYTLDGTIEKCSPDINLLVYGADIDIKEDEDDNIHLTCNSGLDEDSYNDNLTMAFWSSSTGFMSCKVTPAAPSHHGYKPKYEGNGICSMDIKKTDETDEQYCCAVKNNFTQEFVISCKYYKTPSGNNSSIFTAEVASPLAFIIILLLVFFPVSILAYKYRHRLCGRNGPPNEGERQPLVHYQENHANGGDGDNGDGRG